MTIATGIICLVLGMIVLIGQIISTVNFRFAQRLGLQEKDDDTDPLFRRLELNTARWDVLVLWTLPAAGLLMLADHIWWPYLALVAGGISIDTAGRETVKVLGLGKHGVKTGSGKETKLYSCFMAGLFLIGMWCIIFGLAKLV